MVFRPSSVVSLNVPLWLSPDASRQAFARWKSFVANHAEEIVAGDFFVVPPATFRMLYCFVILSHDRRRVLHFNVTANPTAQWTAQQLTEAFPFDAAPRYLLRDNDGIYGKVFRQRVAALGIEDRRTTPGRPWQNAYVVGVPLLLQPEPRASRARWRFAARTQTRAARAWRSRGYARPRRAAPQLLAPRSVKARFQPLRELTQSLRRA